MRKQGGLHRKKKRSKTGKGRKINILLQGMNNMKTDLMQMKKQIDTMCEIVNELKDEVRERGEENFTLRDERKPNLNRKRQKLH